MHLLKLKGVNPPGLDPAALASAAATAALEDFTGLDRREDVADPPGAAAGLELSSAST